PDISSKRTVVVPAASAADVGPKQAAPSGQTPPNCTCWSSPVLSWRTSGQLPSSPVMVKVTPVKALASTQLGAAKNSPSPRKSSAGLAGAPGASATRSAWIDPSGAGTAVTSGGARSGAAKVNGPPVGAPRAPVIAGSAGG